jgi:AmmeMemoRadiSam system protein A
MYNYIMNVEQKKSLLQLARHTLEYYFDTKEKMLIEVDDLDEELTQKRGTFVTLTKGGELRGCIGHIEAVQEIYKDIIDNALSAAFSDNRFRPLEQEELNNIKIEISILSEPRELKYTSTEDLLNQLVPLRDGVIIELGRNGATYLPQVWEGWENPPSSRFIRDYGRAGKEEFLTSLCEKAGLDPDEWKKGNLKVSVYQAEVFCE